MESFIIHFLICNVFICIITGILLAARQLFKKILTSRMQYNLWFLLLVLLAVPFIPFNPDWLQKFFIWFESFKILPHQYTDTMPEETSAFFQYSTKGWINDLGIAASRKTPSAIWLILFILWVIGIIIMILLMLKSAVYFNIIKKSALPLQNSAVRKIYYNCLKELNIKKIIPVYSTAFLKSPVITGLFKPCIYLPIHLVSGYNQDDIRYIILHELQHYKHKDALANYLMDTAIIIYWFNPLVWYALKEMKNDKETACDSSVLEILDKYFYKDYGNTLINFAGNISRLPFPFTNSISTGMKQMQKRILNIANYHTISYRKKLYSFFLYIITAVFLLCFIPFLSIQTAGNSYYSFNRHNKNITYTDLKSYFGKNKGSFVMYNTTDNLWQIYNQEYALTRISPVSTYKIYSALFCLESGIISPSQSFIPWNKQHYIYDMWNNGQTLKSAMQNSVTWYFQDIDKQAGLSVIRDYIKKTGYGNQTTSDNLSSYWADSSLKISPVEQVEMLKKFYYNQFGFSLENINTVKNSIRIASSGNTVLYGKTGTGETDNGNKSGWFIGYIEKNGKPCFFATNIQDKGIATGAAATDITFSILSGMGLWNTD